MWHSIKVNILADYYEERGFIKKSQRLKHRSIIICGDSIIGDADSDLSLRIMWPRGFKYFYGSFKFKFYANASGIANYCYWYKNTFFEGCGYRFGYAK